MSNVIKFERPPQRPPAPPDDFDTEQALRKCREMLRCLADPLMPDAGHEACVVLLLINLNDLAGRCRAEGRPLDFKEHVQVTDEVKDITDLISKMRNAACHIRSKSRNLGDAPFVFNRIVGYMPNAFDLGEVFAGCDFPDDVAIYYGKYRLYLHRHFGRAVEELSRIFAKQNNGL